MATTKFQPPPTWALPVIEEAQTKRSVFNPIWLKWFLDLSRGLDSSGAASGTVSSVSLTLPTQFNVAGSPVVDTGTLAATWKSQTANTVLAGPASGGATAPAFRQLVAGDLPPFDYVSFDTTPTGVPTTTPGTLFWDNVDGNQTLSLVMANGTTTQQIGEEQYFRIKATAAITNGQVVMFTGGVGASGALTGAPATGLLANTALYTMGVATEDIAHNGWGYVTCFGLVRGIDTSGGAEAWTDGQLLYLNPAVVGGLTKNLPTAPSPKVVVAAVVHASATAGSLFIRPSFGGRLGDFEGDVTITAPSDGDILIYNGATGVWENGPSSASTVTVEDAKSLSIYAPSAAENVTLFYASTAMTFSKVRAVVSGASPSVTYSVKSGADRSTASTTHVSATTVTNSTTGANATIGTALIPANSWIWLETSAVSGTVTFFSLNLEF